MTRCLSLLLVLSAAVSCTSDDGATTLAPTQRVEAPVPATVASDWRAQALDRADAVRASKPELADLAGSIQARVTRHEGLVRIVDAKLDVPEAAPLLLERLLTRNETSDVRAALAASLGRTGGDFAEAARGIFRDERSATVREALVGAVRFDKRPEALELLREGLSDEDAGVRALAAKSLGHRPDGAQLADSLIALATSDRDPHVQAESARALGLLQSQASFDALQVLLGHDSAEVRLEALRALGRIDGKRAAGLDGLVALSQDADERVRGAAERVKTQAY